MQQTLADFEASFLEETALDSELDRHRIRQVEVRNQRRRVERIHRQGTLRFVLLCLLLLATAIGVTIAMFQTLYLVMG